ncbi:hypothetical protein M427DRAFT_164904 [Gonapodya prolifera JEL478]|uniref:Uncharacterized protein n=1 Tax=Gonapodya prolifera (strain JEL478) TaxID=1344416 RepID=A0A139AZE5_GONPJ|nr:hypothetical protein M427DRAFT_164904 [Gonapodya prolifera JEL478]|eukprot:KXS22106.1 hypothetical protein M427DRAFT_164904 [Gonapodya prolifera JEL478]
MADGDEIDILADIFDQNNGGDDEGHHHESPARPQGPPHSDEEDGTQHAQKRRKIGDTTSVLGLRAQSSEDLLRTAGVSFDSSHTLPPKPEMKLGSQDSLDRSTNSHTRRSPLCTNDTSPSSELSFEPSGVKVEISRDIMTNLEASRAGIMPNPKAISGNSRIEESQLGAGSRSQNMRLDNKVSFNNRSFVSCTCFHGKTLPGCLWRGSPYDFASVNHASPVL